MVRRDVRALAVGLGLVWLAACGTLTSPQGSPAFEPPPPPASEATLEKSVFIALIEDYRGRRGEAVRDFLSEWPDDDPARTAVDRLGDYGLPPLVDWQCEAGAEWRLPRGVWEHDGSEWVQVGPGPEGPYELVLRWPVDGVTAELKADYKATVFRELECEAGVLVRVELPSDLEAVFSEEGGTRYGTLRLAADWVEPASCVWDPDERRAPAAERVELDLQAGVRKVQQWRLEYEFTQPRWVYGKLEGAVLQGMLFEVRLAVEGVARSERDLDRRCQLLVVPDLETASFSDGSLVVDFKQTVYGRDELRLALEEIKNYQPGPPTSVDLRGYFVQNGKVMFFDGTYGNADGDGCPGEELELDFADAKVSLEDIAVELGCRP